MYDFLKIRETEARVLSLSLINYEMQWQVRLQVRHMAGDALYV